MLVWISYRCCLHPARMFPCKRDVGVNTEGQPMLHCEATSGWSRSFAAGFRPDGKRFAPLVTPSCRRPVAVGWTPIAPLLLMFEPACHQVKINVSLSGSFILESRAYPQSFTKLSKQYLPMAIFILMKLSRAWFGVLLMVCNRFKNRLWFLAYTAPVSFPNEWIRLSSATIFRCNASESSFSPSLLFNSLSTSFEADDEEGSMGSAPRFSLSTSVVP